MTFFDILFATIAALIVLALGAPLVSSAATFLITLAVPSVWRRIAAPGEFPRLTADSPGSGGNKQFFHQPPDPNDQRPDTRSRFTQNVLSGGAVGGWKG